MEAEVIDMADLPVQLPEAPVSAAAARARFFDSGNAFNIKLPPVPVREFGAVFQRASDAAASTGLYACDGGDAMRCPFPATTPLTLASYARIRAGERLDHQPRATAALF